MKRDHSSNRGRRLGIGHMEVILIVVVVVLGVCFCVSRIGSWVSRDIDQTAGGIGDPSKLINHPRFTEKR